MQYIPAKIEGYPAIPDEPTDLVQIQGLIAELSDFVVQIDRGRAEHKQNKERIKKDIAKLQRAGKRLLGIKPRSVELPTEIP